MIPIATIAAVGAAASAAQAVINKVGEAREKNASQNLLATQTQAMGKKPTMQELLAESLNKYASTTIGQRDMDGNGMLSVQEYGEGADKFAKLDFNGNGFIEQSELVRSLQQNQGVSNLVSASNASTTSGDGVKRAYAAQVAPAGDRNLSFSV